ncbi:MAG: transposase [Hormoscilla sp. GM102CHS1]|nr:transposase [Hormoscilla sp. GM102CHS1]
MILKVCWHCGHIHKELKLRDRTFICPNCGFFLDCDWNAAINLAKAGSSPASACGASKSAICLGGSDASKQE